MLSHVRDMTGARRGLDLSDYQVADIGGYISAHTVDFRA